MLQSSAHDAVPGNTGVISSATKGLAVVVLLLLGLRQPLTLGAACVPRAGLLYIAIVVLATRNLANHHPFRQFGPANQVTTLRAALVSVVAGLVGEPETPEVGAMAVAVATAATLLDGLDGWLARRSRMTSAFGARFDMEVDALLILVLSILAWRHGKAGPWVLLSGLLRYVFIAAAWIAPWFRAALPVSRRRQAICVIQVVGLLIVMAPVIQRPLSAWIAAVSLATLSWSFALDIAWLWRHAPDAATAARF
jgi:phosphatidylglycerophosphate synthase